MTIYESAIETYAQYEGRLNDVLREFGTDLGELTRRLHAKSATIAPESAWASDGKDGSAEVTVEGTDYVAYIRKVELVC